MTLLQRDPQLLVQLVDQKFSMSQINERLDTFSQKEKDEIKEKDRKQRIQGLIAKYGRKKVEAAKRNAREDGDKNITYNELKRRIENAKDRLKKGEVKKWDKEKQRWVSNKEEDVNEEPNWNDGVNVRWNLTPNKKEISLNYNGAVIASKKTEKYRAKTKSKSVLDKAMLDFKNLDDPAKNLPGMKKVDEGASIALKVGSSIPWGKVLTGLGAAGTLTQQVLRSQSNKEKKDRIGKGNKKRTKVKQQSPQIKGNKGTMTPAQIRRMKQAGLL